MAGFDSASFLLHDYVCSLGMSLSDCPLPHESPVRRLPIFGERPVDFALREIMTDPSFGRFLFAGKKAGERSELFWAIDTECNPCDASIEDCNAALRSLSEDEPGWAEDAEEQLEPLRLRFLLVALRRSLGREIHRDEVAHACAGLQPLEPPDMPGVYCIKGAGEFVKIGKASRSIRERVREIQTNHPVPLELWAILSANPERERFFHDQLKAHRSHGEWFRLEQPVIKMIWRAREAG